MVEYRLAMRHALAALLLLLLSAPLAAQAPAGWKVRADRSHETIGPKPPRLRIARRDAAEGVGHLGGDLVAESRDVGLEVDEQVAGGRRRGVRAAQLDERVQHRWAGPAEQTVPRLRSDAQDADDESEGGDGDAAAEDEADDETPDESDDVS